MLARPRWLSGFSLSTLRRCSLGSPHTEKLSATADLQHQHSVLTTQPKTTCLALRSPSSLPRERPAMTPSRCPRSSRRVSQSCRKLPSNRRPPASLHQSTPRIFWDSCWEEKAGLSSKTRIELREKPSMSRYARMKMEWHAHMGCFTR